jgi:hypothetical protein
VPCYLEEARRAADLVQFPADDPWVGGDIDDRNEQHGGSSLAAARMASALR